VSKVEKENKDRFEITEMFMAQADHERCFYGIIKRSKDTDGSPHLFSRIVINDGIIQACASDQKELGKMLDEMCIMILDMELHNETGVYIEILGDRFFLN